jgi:hypothetical protein
MGQYATGVRRQGRVEPMKNLNPYLEKEAQGKI